MPTIPGIKSENERFPGGDYTTTIEGFIPSVGRGIQCATSHGLGQNFSKMFNIMVEDPKLAEEKDSKVYVWQNSWGLTTRSIGVMIMTHSDDKGLFLPPRIAPIQVIVIGCGLSARSTEADREQVKMTCDDIVERLKAAGIRAQADHREGQTPGWKYNAWELKVCDVFPVAPEDSAHLSPGCSFAS